MQVQFKESSINIIKTLIRTLNFEQKNDEELEDAKFIKPIIFIKGPKWKQLFFEPFKFKGYYTRFYY